MIKTKNPKKAFTIVELVIVIAVVAILMTIMFVGGTAISNNAKFSTLKSDLRTAEVNIKAALNDPDQNKRLTYDYTSGGSDAEAVKDLLNEYLEDDFQIANLARVNPNEEGLVNANADIPGSSARGDEGVAENVEEVYQGKLTAKDPWGKNYEIYVYNLSENADDAGDAGAHRDATTDWAIVIKSLGKNKLTRMTNGSNSTSVATAFDKDDNYLVIRTYNSEIFTDSHVNEIFATDYVYVDFTEDTTVKAGVPMLTSTTEPVPSRAAA